MSIQAEIEEIVEETIDNTIDQKVSDAVDDWMSENLADEIERSMDIEIAAADAVDNWFGSLSNRQTLKDIVKELLTEIKSEKNSDA